MSGRTCDFPGCDRKHFAYGLCNGHYKQRSRGQELRRLDVRTRASVEIRLLRRRQIDPITGCWEWQGSLDHRGYGRIAVQKKTAYVHRVAWEHYAGQPIPDGRVIDHVCENRSCFNPAHLELVTHAENTNRRRDSQATRTHCPAGHRYAGDNLRIYVDKRGYRHRICRICNKTRSLAYYYAGRNSDTSDVA